MGNYLGAIRSWIQLQTDYDALFCIVDLHAITVPQPPGVLRARTRELAGLLLAAGIDRKRSTLFVQSDVSAHSELAWILNCFIPMGWMNKMTQYKDKAGDEKNVSVGLFDYPALMTADILLYSTDVVPVGSDQKQHVELARNVASRFNSLVGETFRVPEPLIPGIGARVMALNDPRKKMSKSDTGAGQAIFLLDEPTTIRAKIMKATTDSQREIRFDKNRPGLHNLLVMYELFSELPHHAVEAQFAGKGYTELKKTLAELIIEKLDPLQRRYREWAADPETLEHVLQDGARRAQPLAEQTLRKVKESLGLG